MKGNTMACCNIYQADVFHRQHWQQLSSGNDNGVRPELLHSSTSSWGLKGHNIWVLFPLERDHQATGGNINFHGSQPAL